MSSTFKYGDKLVLKEGSPILTNIFIDASGGTITYDGDYKIHTFTSSGTFIVTEKGLAEILVVGGGGNSVGSGSSSVWRYSGGGGGGGTRYGDAGNGGSGIVILRYKMFPILPYPDGLKYYFPFDETSGTTTTDLVGGYIGTCSSTSILGTPGKKNSSADFTKGDTYISIDVSSLGSMLNEYTVGFWLKYDNSHEDVRSFFGTVNTGKASLVMQAYINQDVKGRFFPYVRDITGKVLYGYVDASSFFDDNWHHFLYTMKTDSNIIKTYIDGEERSFTYELQQTPTSFDNFGHPLTLGARNVRGIIGQYADILLDEFAIWDRSLTSGEIKMLYNNGNGRFYNR